MAHKEPHKNIRIRTNLLNSLMKKLKPKSTTAMIDKILTELDNKLIT